MPRFAANLSMMFQEHPFLERFAAARAAGFEGVEFLFPYAFDAADIAARLRENGLSQALFNMPPGDWDKGERGLAALPGREAEVARAVETALTYAKALGCERLHCMPALLPAGVDRTQARATFVAKAHPPAAAGASPSSPPPPPRPPPPRPAPMRVSRSSSSRSTPATCRATSSTTSA